MVKSPLMGGGTLDSHDISALLPSCFIPPEVKDLQKVMHMKHLKVEGHETHKWSDMGPL